MALRHPVAGRNHLGSLVGSFGRTLPSSGPSGHLLPKGEGLLGGSVPLPLGEGAAKRRVRVRTRRLFTTEPALCYARFSKMALPAS